MGKLHTSIIQVQAELLNLTYLLAETKPKEDEQQIIPSRALSMAAKCGLALHKKFGGGRNIALAEALAEQKPLTMEDINTMADFFEKFKLDKSEPGWYDPENPSSKWIRWLLMGDESGRQLVVDTKNIIEEGLKDK
ncbi:hypothetical protein [Nostoc sp.]|uniref:hypothetical protein n=1 Tax=Nostoc sp. TaxID=1180 RepID=UPI002FFC98A6